MADFHVSFLPSSLAEESSFSQKAMWVKSMWNPIVMEAWSTRRQPTAHITQHRPPHSLVLHPQPCSHSGPPGSGSGIYQSQIQPHDFSEETLQWQWSWMKKTLRRMWPLLSVSMAPYTELSWYLSFFEQATALPPARQNSVQAAHFAWGGGALSHPGLHPPLINSLLKVSSKLNLWKQEEALNPPSVGFPLHSISSTHSSGWNSTFFVRFFYWYLHPCVVKTTVGSGLGAISFRWLTEARNRVSHQ